MNEERQRVFDELLAWHESVSDDVAFTGLNIIENSNGNLEEIMGLLSELKKRTEH